MQDPQQATEHPLTQMRPLHLPDGIDAWQIAPGWYVLAALIFFTLATSAFLLIRKHRRELYKRQALIELQNIKANIQKDAISINKQSSELSDLLKRLALTHFPRSLVGPLHGNSWLSFLDEISASTFFTKAEGKLLGDARFRKADDTQLEENFQALMKCIEQSEKLIKSFPRTKNNLGTSNAAV